MLSQDDKPLVEEIRSMESNVEHKPILSEKVALYVDALKKIEQAMLQRIAEEKPVIELKKNLILEKLRASQNSLRLQSDIALASPEHFEARDRVKNLVDEYMDPVSRNQAQQKRIEDIVKSHNPN